MTARNPSEKPAKRKKLPCAFDEWMETFTLQGEIQGKIATCHHVLLTLCRKRFGDPEPKIETALTDIKDFGRLERMVDVLLTIESWEALLAIK